MKEWGKKRLFIGLLSISVLIFAVLVTSLLYLAFHPASSVLQFVLLIIGFALAFLILVLGLGILAIVLSLIRHKPLDRFGRMLFKGALSLYPFALTLGKVFRINSDMIMDSFVEVNNQLIRSYQFEVPAERILILLPHCLQKSTCNARITKDPENCRRCGECNISELLKICEETGVKLTVVTGGTLARKVIKDHHPKAIIAVACQRDLSSGILDVRPLPVLGVRNERPYGPCRDTKVDLEKVKEAISFFKENEC